MNVASVNLWFSLWIEHLTYKHSIFPVGSSVTSQDHTSILFSLLSIIAQLNSLKSAANLSQNPSQLRSLAHRTVCHCQPVWIAPPEPKKCDAYLFLWSPSVMTDWAYFSPWNLGFLPLFSALFSCFAAYEQYLIVEACLHYIVQPPLVRISKCFYAFVHHLQSFVEKLLKSNCRFGTKSVVTVVLCQK